MSVKGLRKSARRKLNSILREFGFKCAWCNEEITTIGYIEGPVIQNYKGTVKWLHGNQTVVSLLATVDHLRDISDGGQSNRENLVPACARCNNERNTAKREQELSKRKMELLSMPRHEPNREVEKITLSIWRAYNESSRSLG